MDDVFKRKLFAAGKIALGSARIVSGAMTATGHGILGAASRKYHFVPAALRIAKNSVEGGMEMIQDGLDDWKRADADAERPNP